MNQPTKSAKNRIWSGGFLLLAIFFVCQASLLALPKDKTSEFSAGAQQKPKQSRLLPAPVVYDPESELNPGGYSTATTPSTTPYRNLGPQPLVSSAVPYVFIRQGIPETGQTNNHMRDKVWVSDNGVVHMVYPIRNSNQYGYIVTAIDSNTAGMNYYNAYGCTGFNPPSLKCPPPGECYPMTYVPSGPDTRPRKLNAGGIFTANVPPGGEVPVTYGHRFIQRTDLGNGFFSRRGFGTMTDSAECQAVFSMDTAFIPNPTPLHTEPTVWPVNDSVWVATFSNIDVSLVGPIWWNYTTDYGKTWTAPASLNIYHPWIGGVDVVSNGNIIYVFSICDPSDPNAFLTTERPVYLKGTYNPASGTITWAGAMIDITGDFELPNYLACMTGLASTIIGDTLHVLWLDWNNYNGNGFSGSGGHVHNAIVFPDGSVEVHKVADIKIDGRLKGYMGAATPFGLAVCPWSQCDFSYDSTRHVLYALWSQMPDDGFFDYDDYSDYGYGVYDIFSSASPNNGRAWDDPRNVTATNRPGCSGGPGDECQNEYWFTVAPRVSKDTIWIFSLVQKAPGLQETALFRNPPVAADPGPITVYYDEDRLYKAPARGPIPSLRSELGLLPGDTLIDGLDGIHLEPRGNLFSLPLQLSNIGFINFTLDSTRLTGTLNDGYLTATTDVIVGTTITGGNAYSFNLTFNPSGVGPTNQGLRSGNLEVYVHTDDPSVPPSQSQKVHRISLSAYVVTDLCFNRKVQIHSATNRTDIGTQGSVKELTGYGMNYFLNGEDHFYDGGIFIANSELNGPILPTGLRRRVSYQHNLIKLLRCLSDGILDSVPGTGSYYNLFIKSIGTDMSDSTLVWQNIWEQSTHPDSSDFLIQTTRVINVGGDPIDSVAIGVLYDIDLEGGTGPTASSAGTNVGGDTIILGPDGLFYWMGWISGNDISIDTCSSNASMYGFVVIPDLSGNTGDTVHPRGAMVCKTISLGLNYTPYFPYPGSWRDTLFQRYAWYLDVNVSTRDRDYDTLTGVWWDTMYYYYNYICGDLATGPPHRDDLAYLALAKKVHNFPVNGGGQNVVGNFGLEALAASVDTTFSGPGETYTVIHVASVTGMAGLITNAQRGIDWYNNHAGLHVGPRQTRLKGDLNNDGRLTPADVSIEVAYVFANQDAYGGSGLPLCVADLNNSGDLSLSDVVTLLNGVFLAAGCPNCLRPCI